MHFNLKNYSVGWPECELQTVHLTLALSAFIGQVSALFPLFQKPLTFLQGFSLLSPVAEPCASLGFQLGYLCPTETTHSAYQGYPPRGSLIQSSLFGFYRVFQTRF